MTTTATSPTVDLKREVLETAQAMLHSGLVEGTAGNVSARLPDGNIVMTPSSVAYDTMTLDDLVVIDPDGNVVEGTRAPTTEKALHLACYRRYEEIGAVIHTHTQSALMFTLVHEPIPAVIEVRRIRGRRRPDRRVQAHRFRRARRRGSRAVSTRRAAVLMANHGMVAVGKSPADVLHIAGLVERTAEIVVGRAAARRRSCRCPTEIERAVRRLLPLRAHREVLTSRSTGSALARMSVQAVADGEDTVSTRSSAATMSLKARMRTVSLVGGAASTTAPPQSVLSTRITPVGRSRGAAPRSTST